MCADFRDVASILQALMVLALIAQLDTTQK
jgi:hypothetical protein